jgi:hypothetical protein
MKKELLAPNGNPSNLTAEQYKLVRTPEFKKWFGDWENDPENASKVVDNNGEPLVVYHGTNKRFNIFKNKFNDIRVGHWFTDNKNLANNYGKSKLYFINARKITDKIRDDYDEKGFDAYIYKYGEWDDVLQKKKPFFNINVYNPNQIKLADGTNTTFDKNNNDIRFDKGGIADSGTPDYLKFLIG